MFNDDAQFNYTRQSHTRVIEFLDTFVSLAQELGQKQLAAQVVQWQQAINRDHHIVTYVGGFGVGKGTLINVLLQHDPLPASTTAFVRLMKTERLGFVLLETPQGAPRRMTPATARWRNWWRRCTNNLKQPRSRRRQGG